MLRPCRLCVLLCSALLLAACAGTTAAPAMPPSPTVTATPVPPTTAPSPTIAPSPTATALPPTATALPPTPTPITGERALPRGMAPQRLVAVMLDNHPAAYPQVGMDKAVLVFEALAEHGLTRYMAVFAPGISPEAPEIGAVRSARDYFVEWAKGLDAVYAHAGGSPRGLLLAETAIEIANLDALRNSGSPYFYRDNEREAPHNLFTSSALLQEFVTDAEAAAVDLTDHGFVFKEDTPSAQRPERQDISYYFVTRDDPAGWTYDAATNGYLRTRREEPHIDGRTGEQLWFKNVVVLEIPTAPIPDDDKGRITQEVVGEGRGRLFADGVMREIRWHKPAPFAPLRLYTTIDAEAQLNAGPVWIAALPSLDHMTVE